MSVYLHWSKGREFRTAAGKFFAIVLGAKSESEARLCNRVERTILAQPRGEWNRLERDRKLRICLLGSTLVDFDVPLKRLMKLVEKVFHLHESKLIEHPLIHLLRKHIHSEPSSADHKLDKNLKKNDIFYCWLTASEIAYLAKIHPTQTETLDQKHLPLKFRKAGIIVYPGSHNPKPDLEYGHARPTWRAASMADWESRLLKISSLNRPEVKLNTTTLEKQLSETLPEPTRPRPELTRSPAAASQTWLL